jgi:hypothetical protein
MIYGKEPIVRSRKWLDTIGTLPCIVTGAREGVVPHHLLRGTGEKGMGIKSGDDKSVPIHTFIHDRLHGVGDETEFFRGFGIDDPVGVAQFLYRCLHIFEAEEYIIEKFSKNWEPNKRRIELCFSHILKPAKQPMKPLTSKVNWKK